MTDHLAQAWRNVTTTPEHVLLLGSDRDEAARVATVLQSHGMRVVAATDVDAGLAHAKGSQLAIIDRLDGRLDAPGAIARMRATPGLGELPILGLAGSEDVEERVRFLEAGADDVMGRPFDPTELEARVDTLLARGQRSRRAIEEPPVIAPSRSEVAGLVGVFGPKGGSGTTTIAVNTALEASRRGGRRVAVIDLDARWGDVAMHLNVVPRTPVSEVIRDPAAMSDPELLDRSAERHPSGLAVFGAAQRPDERDLLGPEHVGQLLLAARDAYDLAVVDAGSDLDVRAMTLLEHVDRLIIPVTGEIPGLRAVRTLLEILDETERGRSGVILILNHQFARDMLRRDEIQGALGATIDLELPYDQSLYLAAVNAGQPLVIGAERSVPAERFSALVDIILGEGQASEGSKSGDARQRFGRLRTRSR